MRVFKYRGGNQEVFKRDLTSLQENFFWAPTRECLNDPFEGCYDRTILINQLEIIASCFLKGKSKDEAHSKLIDSLESLLSFTDTAGIYSLSTSVVEELLWAHYGFSHQGFCIEYDLEQLIEFEKNDYKKIVVDYANSQPILSVDDLNELANGSFLKKMFGVKSSSWQYENEIRVITSQSGQHEYDFRAVKAIYFGLRMCDEHKDRLMYALRGRGIEYQQISLKEKSYQLCFFNVEDKYKEYARYKYSVAPIADGAINPEYVNDKYKNYVDYLYRAAEIVRREPYCNQIDMVEFSSTKSTPEQPVIFVQYERKKFRHINHYLTLTEIDEQYAQLSDLESQELSV